MTWKNPEETREASASSSPPAALVQNAADAGQVRAARQKEQDRRARDREDLRVLLATPQGRRFLWRLLSQAGIFATSFSPEALKMAYREGGRNLGLTLVGWLSEIDPAALYKLAEEANRDSVSCDRVA